MGFFSSAWSWFTGGSIGASLAKTALLGYVSRLLNKSTGGGSGDVASEPDKGVRLQLTPSTDNQIPVLYGDAYFGGNLTDAQLSNDYKKMTYCLTLAEVTGEKLSTGLQTAYTFNKVYLNNNRVVFKADGFTVDYTLDSGGNQDISMRDLVKVYFYKNQTGIQPTGSSGTTPPSYTVMPGWTLATHPMSNLLYAIVEVTYNRDKNVSALPDCQFHITSNMTLAGDCLVDYMLSTRYGAGIDVSEIDTSFTALNTFCSTGFTYTNTSNQSTTSQISINGIVDTNKTILDNMEEMAKAASSWITYDIHSGKWTVIINKAGTSIASFTDGNIIGDIAISGTSLTQLSNAADVKYQNTDILDKTDFVKIEIPEVDLYANEPRSTLQLSLPYTNKQVVATKIGLQELKQARVDKIISFRADYSYINLHAGDIIDVTSAIYGFTNKVFRIITVSEAEDDSGSLQVEIKALEYDADVYAYTIQQYTVTTDSGILGIGSIGKPNVPTVTKTEQANVPKVVINAQVPSGIVDAVEFWLTFDVTVGNDSARTYIQIGRYQNTNGTSLTEDAYVSYTYSGLGQGNFFVKVRGINNITTGPYSDPTGLIEYKPVVVADTISNEPVSIGGQLMGLGILTLLNNLDKLFAGDSSKGLVDKLLDKFFGESRDPAKTKVTDILKADTAFTSELSGEINDLGNVSIDELSDVDTTTTMPASKNVLAWNGSAWVPVSLASCCSIVLPVTPVTPSTACFISISNRYPPDRTTYQDPITGDTSDTAPITGSYYMKFGGISGGSIYGGMTKGTGNIKLYKSDGTLVETVTAASTTVTGNLLAIPFATRELGTDYYILMDEGVVVYCDCKSPAITLPEPWNFNTPLYSSNAYGFTPDGIASATALTVTSAYPSGTDFCIPPNFGALTFNRAIAKGSGNVYIKDFLTDAVVKTLTVDSLTQVSVNSLIFPSSITGLSQTTKYYWNADAGVALGKGDCFTSGSSAQLTGKTFTFTTGLSLGVVNFIVSSSPLVDTTKQKVNRQSNLQIVFNKPISLQSVGTIVINSNTGIHQTINLSNTFANNKTSELVWVSGNSLYINPTKDFDVGKSYYVTLTAACVKDVCGIGNGVINDSTTFAFATDPGPTPQIAVASSGSIAEEGISLTYDRTVVPGNGQVILYDSTNTQVLAVGPTSPGVTITEV